MSVKRHLFICKPSVWLIGQIERGLFKTKNCLETCQANFFMLSNVKHVTASAVILCKHDYFNLFDF